MQSPLALILNDDALARESACDALKRAGIAAMAAGSPREAAELLREHPSAIVTLVDGRLTPPQIAHLKSLQALRAGDALAGAGRAVLGRSEAAGAMRERIQDLAGTHDPVLFVGEAGSGRAHAARFLHEAEAPSRPFVVVQPEDAEALETVFAASEGTVFLASIDKLPWPTQEALAARLSDGRLPVRVTGSTSLHPEAAAADGRLSAPLSAAFSGAILRVPPLRERAADIAPLARAFIEDVCRLNGLPPIALAPEAGEALEGYAWPGNLTQLRSAIESAVILAEGGVLRARNLPEFIRSTPGPAAQGAGADRRFRDAKRTVVEAFERAYLEDLLKRHRGNVTGAADQSGMLRSALQRLLRKHALHSADFRSGGAPGHYAT